MKLCFQPNTGLLSGVMLGALMLWVALASPTRAVEECANDPLPCVIRVLAQEKDDAEEMARLLHAYARGEVTREADGIRLYASTRGAFSGVIEELKVDLDRARSPVGSNELENAVRSAVDQSHAFAGYVDEVLPKEGTARGLLDIAGILKGSGELIKSLIDGGLGIWDKFHDRDKEEKLRIREQLDKLKWKSFGEATG